MDGGFESYSTTEAIGMAICHSTIEARGGRVVVTPRRRMRHDDGTEMAAASVVIAVVNDDRGVLESILDLLACADISETPGTAICDGALMAGYAGSTRLIRWPERSGTGRVP